MKGITPSIKKNNNKAHQGEDLSAAVAAMAAMAGSAVPGVSAEAPQHRVLPGTGITTRQLGSPPPRLSQTTFNSSRKKSPIVRVQSWRVPILFFFLFLI